MIGFLAFRIEFGCHQSLQLIGLDLAVDDRPEAVEEKIHPHLVLGEPRVALEDGAVVRTHHVLFEGDEAIAPAHHEDFVEHLEQFEIVRPAGGIAGHSHLELVHNVQQHLAGAGDDQHAQPDAQDDGNLAHLQHHQWVAPGEHKPADGRGENDESSDKDQHGKRERGAGQRLRMRWI